MKELCDVFADYAGILALKACVNLLTANCLILSGSEYRYQTFRAKENLDLSLLDEYERFVVKSCRRRNKSLDQIIRKTIRRIHKADPVTQRQSTEEEQAYRETVFKIVDDAYNFRMPESHCSV